MADSRTTTDAVPTTSSSASMMRVKLDDTKAGMKGLDKDKINKIIYEASKGSKFYQNEQRRERELAAKIHATLDELNRLPETEMEKAERRADGIFRRVEASRDFSRVIVHVDMDCFYAAVHMRDDPSLKKVPMAVGGIGMLSTSNYIARRFGVRAAMPGFIAKKLCPELIIIPSDFPKYNAVASVVRGVIAEYDPEFESGGCDEAYLDLTTHLALRNSTPGLKEVRVDPRNETMIGSCRCDFSTNERKKEKCCGEKKEQAPEEAEDGLPPIINRNADVLKIPIIDRNSTISCPTCELIKPGRFLFSNSIHDAVEEMRLKIFLATRLTASAGVAPNAPLAKICSDQNKPNGQFLLPFEREPIVNFVRDLPVRKWPGIGKVQEKTLHALNVIKLKDVRENAARLLLTATSEGAFEYYAQAALGVGRNRLCGGGGESERKSVSTETTFSTMTDPGEMSKLLLELCRELAADVEAKGYFGRTITLKLKNDDFKVVTRATTVGYKTRDADKMFKVAHNSLKIELKKNPKLKLRLMGVRLSQLEEGGADNGSTESQSAIENFLGVPKGAGAKGKKKGNSSLANPISSPSTEYSCPICDAFVSISLDRLNSHVDACLLETAESQVSLQQITRTSTTDEYELDKDEDNPGESQKILDQSSPDLFDSEEEEEEETDNAENQRAVSADNMPTPSTDAGVPSLVVSNLNDLRSFTCPVCAVEIDGDLAALNNHVDLCVLGIPAIPANTTSSSSSTPRSKSDAVVSKRKRRGSGATGQSKMRRIDSFFAKSSKA